MELRAEDTGPPQVRPHYISIIIFLTIFTPRYIMDDNSLKADTVPPALDMTPMLEETLTAR